MNFAQKLRGFFSGIFGGGKDKSAGTTHAGDRPAFGSGEDDEHEDVTSVMNFKKVEEITQRAKKTRG